MPLSLAAFPWIFVAFVLAAAVLVIWLRRRSHTRVPAPDGGASGGVSKTVLAQERMPRVGAQALRPALGSVASWGYQLQDLDPAVASASPFDMLVIDHALDGDDETALDPAQLARLKTKPDGGRRLLLAYLSIGEAETFRSYWQAKWSKKRPHWLVGENPDWPENFAVRYWDKDWQRLMFGAPGACLDKLIAQGFDGVYLDKCDVYEDLQRRHRKVAKPLKTMESLMVEFVGALCAYARARDPDFLIVMQNAEGLLAHEDLRRALDGVAKEELIFGQDGGETRNQDDDFQYSRHYLDKARADAKPVFVVEYLNDRRKIRKARAITRELGYVLAISDKDRELDRLDFDALSA